jgi:hypothetical protein
MAKSVHMSQPQRMALLSARERGSPIAHLSGAASHGGWQWTRRALIKRGWLTREDQITPAGNTALDVELSALRCMRASPGL